MDKQWFNTDMILLCCGNRYALRNGSSFSEIWISLHTEKNTSGLFRCYDASNLAYVSGKLKCFHYLVFGDNSSEFRSNCKKISTLKHLPKKSEIKFKQIVHWCSTHTFDTKNSHINTEIRSFFMLGIHYDLKRQI